MPIRPLLWCTTFVILTALLSAAAPMAATMQAAATPTPQAQPAPPCGTLGRIVENQPIFDATRFCPEYLLRELPLAGLPAITSIAYTPPCDPAHEPRDWCGALFFTRPDTGTLNWIGAFHADTLTYDVNTFASGLNAPNGLAWREGAWYVSGGQNVYRLADENGDNSADRVEVVIGDLPEGAGFWTGSIGFGPDGRLYVSKGADCNACEEADPRRGAILSYAVDGSDERIFAAGLRSAFDFAWHLASGDLWTADAGRDGLGENLPLEELNRAAQVGQHFGWPYCYTTPAGVIVDETVTGSDSAFCREAAGPEMTLQARSAPAGMIFYSGDAFPELAGDLLLVAGGSWNRRTPSGYALVRVCFDPAGEPEPCLDQQGRPILDAQGGPANQEVLVPFADYRGHSLEDLHVQGQSFFPDHPVDVAVSPEGWIVISVMEGRLIRLRPASQ